jgi:DNA repair protein RadA/Sms
MAKKDVHQYVCSNCGAVASSWSGRCFNCGEWNTLVEQAPVTFLGTTKGSGGKRLIAENLEKTVAKDYKRLATNITEVDSVLGGGIVAGSVNLIAGQPGIGKSTLLMQLAQELAKQVAVLYVSGEESAHQVGLRAERLGVTAPNLQIATANSANDIAATIGSAEYRVVIVDSIQMVSVNELSSAAGTVSQITASTQVLTSAAKQTNTAVILVGRGTAAGGRPLRRL